MTEILMSVLAASKPRRRIPKSRRSSWRRGRRALQAVELLPSGEGKAA